MASFSPSGVAMMAVACGTIGPRSQSTMDLVLASAVRCLPEFAQKELAALITACALMGPQVISGGCLQKRFTEQFLRRRRSWQH